MLIERGNYAAQPEMENTFLVDGRTWNYRNNNTKDLFSIAVNGDSLFEGKQCKILEYTSNGVRQMEPPSGIEPPTSSLPRMCSTY